MEKVDIGGKLRRPTIDVIAIFTATPRRTRRNPRARRSRPLPQMAATLRPRTSGRASS